MRDERYGFSYRSSRLAGVLGGDLGVSDTGSAHVHAGGAARCLVVWPRLIAASETWDLGL